MTVINTIISLTRSIDYFSESPTTDKRILVGGRGVDGDNDDEKK